MTAAERTEVSNAIALLMKWRDSLSEEGLHVAAGRMAFACQLARALMSKVVEAEKAASESPAAEVDPETKE